MTPILLLIRICAYHFLALLLPLVLTLLTLTGCTRQLIETSPEEVTDVSDVVITCDATQGNKGLLDYEGDVYIHLGLITSKSKYKDDWQHVKFAWGSRDTPAQAKPAGKNKWSYSIKEHPEVL